MRKSILLLLLFSTTLVVKGQNLVPNGGFEQYTSCPNNFAQLDSALFWHQPTTASSDYFNQCAPLGISVPYNAFGFQQAHSGVAYGGIYLFTGGIPLNYREYCETSLLSPLNAGACYHIEF